MSKPSLQFFGTILFYSLAAIHPVSSAEVTGKVVHVEQDTLEVRITGKLLPKTSDKAEVFYRIPGTDIDALAATGNVANVSQDSVSVRITKKTSTIRAGFLVKITTDNPTKPAVNEVAPGLTIGVAMPSMEIAYYKTVVDNLTKAVKPYQFEVIIEDAQFDPESQNRQIDSYIAKDVAAIVLSPVDLIQVRPAVRRANQAGIPVFTCDVVPYQVKGVKIASHITTDNVQGGKLAAKAMIEALGESGGDVAILTFSRHEAYAQRVIGFREYVELHNKTVDSGHIKIVAEYDGGASATTSRYVTETALQKWPKLAGIFAINDTSVFGACHALAAANNRNAKVIGFDGQTDARQMIKEGMIYADVIHRPDLIGSRIAETIANYLAGETIEPIQLIETDLYRKADALKDPLLMRSERRESDSPSRSKELSLVLLNCRRAIAKREFVGQTTLSTM